jgi:nucleotide-binding universal stress UspA family protein
MGSVANQVLQKGATPVLLLRPDRAAPRPAQPPRTVIVPLDGSDLAEQLVPYAAGLAMSLGADLQLLHVVDPSALPHPDEEESRHGGTFDQLASHREGWAKAYLSEVAKSLQAEGIPAELKVAFGRAEEGILDAAGQSNECLVAMATHGRSGWSRLLMGSVASQVLQKGQAPVLLLRPDRAAVRASRPPQTIIVPLDGSTLAERALPIATSLAGRLGAHLLLTRIVAAYSPAPTVVMGAGADDYVMIPAEDADARRYLEGQVHALCSDHIDAVSVLGSGDPGGEVVKLASSTPECLVVMSTHGRSGFQRLMLGSVADRVVRESGAPVLVMRPDR